MTDPAPPPLTALVFAGGAARRMGGEKCSVEYAGRGLLARALDLARAVSDDIVLLPGARRHDDVDALRRVADWPDVAGPLGALGAGLEAAGHDWCLALACDMPHLEAAHIAGLVARAAVAPVPSAVVLTSAAGREPFGALYHRALLPALRAHVDGARGDSGDVSLQGWLAACVAAGRLVELPVTAPDCLHNVNTPADLVPVPLPTSSTHTAESPIR